jgi:hypothetical protein
MNNPENKTHAKEWREGGKKKLLINFLNITQNKPTESNKILKAS